MKKFYLLIAMVVALLSNATARENPFEETAMFEEDFARMQEMIEGIPYEFQEKNDPNQYEKMSEPPKPKVEPKPKPKPKPKVVSKPKVPNENIVYVPLREQTHVKKASIFIIPGVEIKYEGKKLVIESKYEVFQKFDINKENKIVLDFRAQTSFYTIKKDLSSEYYKGLTVGNHPKQKYFRVAITLPSTPKDYRVTYDKNLVTIMFEESSLKQIK